MSDIHGEGHGSDHDWKHSHTSEGRQTRYDCKDCGHVFWHDYNRIVNIFEAMEKAGVPEKCSKKPKADDFVLCSVLAFNDDTLAVQLLHRGTEEECVKAAEFISALSYNGPKRVVESCVRWMPYQTYVDAMRTRPNPGYSS
jgi:hypothetical protein